MTLGIDATVRLRSTRRPTTGSRPPTSRSTARTTRGSTRGCRRRRSRARASRRSRRRSHPADVAYLYYVLCGDDGAPPVQRRLRRVPATTSMSASAEQARAHASVQGAHPNRGRHRLARRRTACRRRSTTRRSRRSGCDWVYVPLPVRPGSLLAALAGLAALGFAGANVTMPHKTEVADLDDELSEDARRLRAVNTIVVRRRARSAGDNTDAPGFDGSCGCDAGFEPGGTSALIFGAGGAARACALALARAGWPPSRSPRASPPRPTAVVAALDGFADRGPCGRVRRGRRSRGRSGRQRHPARRRRARTLPAPAARARGASWSTCCTARP